MLSLAVARLPEGPAWSYELKFDGYRALGVKTEGRIQLLSRNGKDFTKRFASIATALEKLPDETVADGEIVAYDPQGRPSFNVLQNHRSGGPELQFFAFDLLTLRGADLTTLMALALSVSRKNAQQDPALIVQRLVAPSLRSFIRRRTSVDVISRSTDGESGTGIGALHTTAPHSGG